MRLRSKKVLTQEEPLALSSNFELFCARRKMSDGAMYALTIKPLWLWAILHAGKDVENRVWTTKFRGTFLLHSSKACSEKEYLQAYEFIYSINSDVAETAPDYKTLMREYAGKICGSVELADVFKPYPSEPTSVWHMEDCFGFKLQNPREFARKTPFKGALKFFEVDREIVGLLK